MTIRTYGTDLPGLPPGKFAGKLIVVEGADGSGRTTEVELLKNWLEIQGHAVVDVGLRRSNLVSEEIDRAKQGHTLGPTTMALLYAADFGDQLENKIVPALSAGSTVLADRYIYTLMARAIGKYGSLDYWESGMDLSLSRDLFESFFLYQDKLAVEFEWMAKDYGFHLIDANRRPEQVDSDIRALVEPLYRPGAHPPPYRARRMDLPPSPPGPTASA